MDSIDSIITVASRLTVGGLLLLAVIALLRELVVPGSTHQRELAERDRQLAEMSRERDEWKRLALNSTQLAADTARAMDPSVPPLTTRPRCEDRTGPATAPPAETRPVTVQDKAAGEQDGNL